MLVTPGLRALDRRRRATHAQTTSLPIPHVSATAWTCQVTYTNTRYRGRFEWEKIIGRIVVPPQHRAVKLVAMMVARFADAYDGSDVYPGEERLAAICQLGRSTVRESLKWLRDNQLLERRSKGSNRGYMNMADVYQLCAPDDWETRFTVLPEWEKDDELMIPRPRRSNPQPLGSHRKSSKSDSQRLAAERATTANRWR